MAVVEAHLPEGREVDGFEDGPGGLGAGSLLVFSTEELVVLENARDRLLGDVAFLGDHFVRKVLFEEIDHLEASAGVALASGLPHEELGGVRVGAFPLE